MDRFRKITLGLGLFGLAGPLYLIPNHYPPYSPFELPLTRVDHSVPFLPATIWIYLSEYLLVFSAYLLVEDPRTLRGYLKGTLVLLLFSALVFLAFPTTYPRHLFPLPGGTDPATRFLFELQRAGDTPNNCLPSLHVATVLMAALALKQNKRWFPVYLLWAVLISISTLTTKQHYFWDVLSGGALALGLDRYFVARSGRS
ncbi:MAG: phosphatase PAP2 family protein [Proteobacteria bacterium]|nr:phosphatase PAP2 family protein [Pseudomonadota bacterium]